MELDPSFDEYRKIPDAEVKETGEGENGDEQRSTECDGSSPGREEEILDLDDIEV